VPSADARLHTHLDTMVQLGKRLAELHAALAGDADSPAFAPELFTTLYQRSLYQSMRNLKAQVFYRLQQRLAHLPAPAQELGRRLLERQDDVLKRFHGVLEQKFTTWRTRIHGDLNLGQVLFTGKDFSFIDFEGNPSRSISERRLKRSPLRDVASMVRSFHYAALSALYGTSGGSRHAHAGVVRPEDQTVLEPWASFWYAWSAASFLKGYLAAAGDADFLPRARQERKALFEIFLLEKAVQELGHELDHRPDWARIPLAGILDLLAGS
jgi:maltose alpha-D-glucosyltransferase/alpha-amylase